MRQSPLEAGCLINNRYKIVRPLGEGSMGGVYLALDSLLGENKVALKVLHKNLTNAEEIVKRFFREVELMNKVNHSAIARTFDVGQDQSLVYFSMEYLEGSSLDTIISPSQIIPVQRISNIIRQVLEGLEAIHSLGIIHRDLKPSNLILLPGDVVKITDFGIARDETSELTELGAVLGTLEYMAPELILGHKITHQADLYSVGCILYKLLCCRLPFDTTNPGKLLLAHVEQHVIPPAQIRTDVPQWLSHLTMKLLAKTPRERIQSASQALDIIRSNQSRPSSQTPLPVLPLEPTLSERRESSKIYASLRFQPAELTELLNKRKRTRTFAIIGGLIGFLALVVFPGIVAVRSYWFICDVLRLR